MKKHKSKLVNSSRLNNIKSPMQIIKEIKHLLMTGQISYDEAKERAENPLKEINEKMAKISKKFGFRPTKVTLGKLLR